MSIIKYEDYKNIDAFSYSMIAGFKYLDIIKFHKKWILKEVDEETKSFFIFGDLVEQVLTPNVKIEDYFYIANDIPTDKMRLIADYAINKLKTSFTSDLDSILLEARTKCEYYMNYKDETILKKIKEDTSFANYLDIKTNTSKTIILLEDYMKAIDIKNTIMSIPKISKYFEEPKEGFEILYQPVYQYLHLGFNLKMRADILYIDHVNKTVHIVDLKTTSSGIFEFVDSIKKWNYAIQFIMYSLIVQGNFPEYSISFSFLAISSIDNVVRPILYNMDNDLLKDYNEVTLTILLIQKHIDNNQWKYKEGFEENEVFVKSLD